MPALGRKVRKVTVGEAVLAMILNALGADVLRRPLCQPSAVFDAGFFPQQAGGQADKARVEGGGFERRQSRAGTGCEIGARGRPPTPILWDRARVYHLDTSRFTFYGQYDEQEEMEAISITRGYAGHERPDLKQAVVALSGCLETSALRISEFDPAVVSGPGWECLGQEEFPAVVLRHPPRSFETIFSR